MKVDVKTQTNPVPKHGGQLHDDLNCYAKGVSQSKYDQRKLRVHVSKRGIDEEDAVVTKLLKIGAVCPQK